MKEIIIMIDKPGMIVINRDVQSLFTVYIANERLVCTNCETIISLHASYIITGSTLGTFAVNEDRTVVNANCRCSISRFYVGVASDDSAHAYLLRKLRV